MPWPEKIRSILSCGMPLNDFGVNNWALTKEQALFALDEFEKQGILILGGSVQELVDDEPRYNYDNWSSDKDADESLEIYVSRSINGSRQYINNYQNPSKRETFFVLTPKGFESDESGWLP